MLRKISLILILIILGVLICVICNLSTFGSVDNNEINQKLTAKDKLRIEDFIIGGIYINQPIEEVIEILGKPIKIQVIPDGFKGSDEIIHYFPDITIITSERRKRVFQIKIDNKGIRTFRGIAVGDHERDVYYYYGMTKKYEDLITYQMFVDYATSDAQYILDFYIKNNRVSAIEIYIYHPD